MNLDFISFLLLVGVQAWWLQVQWINTNNVMADRMVAQLLYAIIP